jgi:dTDP-4-dehydrorhamnose 3,5-epimerase
MQIVNMKIPDVLLLKPQVFRDDRGFFLESYNQNVFASLGIRHGFVQDNHSRSHKNVLRGLHYQVRQPQGKLVRVILGEVFDVAVDLRRESATFGQSITAVLSAETREMLWVPPGFAHGFLVLSDWAEFIYKTTDFYAPQFERTIQWNDPDLAIAWPISGEPQLSAKDMQGVRFREAEVYTAPLTAVESTVQP